MAKQSSSKMSSLAARVMQMSDDEINAMPKSEIRSLAASVLSQDETPKEPRWKRLIKAFKG